MLPTLQFHSSKNLDHFLEYVQKKCETLEDSVTSMADIRTTTAKSFRRLPTDKRKPELEILTVGLERKRRRSRVISYLRLKLRGNDADPVLIIYRCNWNSKQPIISIAIMLEKVLSVTTGGTLSVVILIAFVAGILILCTIGARDASVILPGAIFFGITLTLFVVVFLQIKRSITETEEDAKWVQIMWMQLLNEYNPNANLVTANYRDRL